MGDKLHRREGNNPDHQLRPLNDRSVIKEVGVQRQPGGERSLEESTRASRCGRSGSENVGLSNANIGENQCPENLRVPPQGVRRGRENASSQCPSTRRYGAEVTMPYSQEKLERPSTKGTCTQKPTQCRKVKEVGDLMTGEPATEAPVNGGRNYNGPKVAEIPCRMRTTCTWTERPYEALLFPGIGFGPFLRSLGGRREAPPCGGVRAIRPTGQGTVSGRQFLWGVGLPKGNGGVQKVSSGRTEIGPRCKGRRELDCKTHPSSRDESRP
ncbi:hypothetical protein H6P81_021545 [Aristolochia fimbriata]|uniref:Uncharacterized protein n=1 Tax=Aristolochia fimbriata TaxID=158543 RepID=A0AAV7DSQ2_ARIFI|nr:hypothetical protein H6P81_021545 [Aristolochia fimbriata]